MVRRYGSAERRHIPWVKCLLLVGNLVVLVPGVLRCAVTL